jgi:hypothetical protein
MDAERLTHSNAAQLGAYIMVPVNSMDPAESNSGACVRRREQTRHLELIRVCPVWLHAEPPENAAATKK